MYETKVETIFLVGALQIEMIRFFIVIVKKYAMAHVQKVIVYAYFVPILLGSILKNIT